LCQYVSAASSIKERDAPGQFISWLHTRSPVYADHVSGRFDIGNLDSYLEADRAHRYRQGHDHSADFGSRSWVDVARSAAPASSPAAAAAVPPAAPARAHSPVTQGTGPASMDGSWVEVKAVLSPGDAPMDIETDSDEKEPPIAVGGSPVLIGGSAGAAGVGDDMSLEEQRWAATSMALPADPSLGKSAMMRSSKAFDESAARALFAPAPLAQSQPLPADASAQQQQQQDGSSPSPAPVQQQHSPKGPSADQDDNGGSRGGSNWLGYAGAAALLAGGVVLLMRLSKRG